MVRNINEINDEGGEVSTVWQSKRSKELLLSMEKDNPETYKVLISEWSDGFDQNGMNKGNRGSVHITTFSIFGKHGNNDQELSFPAGVCNDKSSKIEIRRKLYEDINELKNQRNFSWEKNLLLYK